MLPFLATINLPCGACFYSSVGGPLPYVIGPRAPERFFILRITRPLRGQANP
jgi:hypothetical protein